MSLHLSGPQHLGIASNTLMLILEISTRDGERTAPGRGIGRGIDGGQPGGRWPDECLQSWQVGLSKQQTPHVWFCMSLHRVWTVWLKAYRGPDGRLSAIQRSALASHRMQASTVLPV